MTRSTALTYLVLGLTAFGLLMVGNASIVNAARDFQDKWYYLKLQSVWALLGLAGFFFMSRYPHQKLEKLAAPLFLATIFLLVAVLIPGIGSKLLGARRWINLGFASFQPAEFAKLTMAIYLAALFKRHVQFRQFMTSLLIVCGLIMIEPDLGTTLVIFGMGILLYFGSGGSLTNLLLLAPVAALGILALILISPYRAARLATFFNTSADPQGASYQIRQALIGLGSGGMFGVGLGQSRQKYEFLPEVTTDSIFAVIGEEMGLLGSVIVLISFLTLIVIGLQIAREATAPFSRLLALALISGFGTQIFINISALVALVPFTGIPLLFVSYGGSSLFVTLISSGILVNIARNRS